MPEPLRFGIVGCGGISHTHAECLKRLETEGLARLVAGAETDADRAEAFGSKYGVSTVPTLDALLQRPDLDVVTICTPSGLHAQMASQVARAGKHILSEKPVDVWLTPVDQAIADAKKAGVVYGAIFQERFSDAAQKVKRAVDAGAFGEIVLACAETKWYRAQDYYDSGDWRGTWALDAGVFSNQGIHSLDKVQWLAGPVAEVLSATLRPGLHRNIESETLGVATVRFENGALGTITMTTLSYSGFPERVDVSGTRGSAMLVGDDLSHFKTAEPWEDADPPATATPDTRDADEKASDPLALWGENHLRNIRDFALAVREGRQPAVTATEARPAVALLNMIYRKAAVGPFA